jgi:dihydropyrimidinase
VRAADFFSNGDFSPYEGWEVTGWPTVTISRGEVIVENGQATETRGRGRMARRERTMAV